jgi:hypothetical protein
MDDKGNTQGLGLSGEGGGSMKRIIVLAFALLLVGAVGYSVDAASDEGKTASRSTGIDVHSKLGRQGDLRVDDAVERTLRAARCRTLQCINRTLKALTRAVGLLLHETFDCEVFSPVTQYFGYDYNFDSFLTTALDFTETGDPTVDARMLHYVC